MASQPIGARKIPSDMAENFRELFPEHEDDFEDYFLEYQKCVFESLQDKESSNLYQGYFPRSLLELDEAIALSLQLQETENSLQNVSISESSGTWAGNRGASSTEHSAAVQLQSLGETIGSQRKGLSEELLSSLPSHKFKTGECVICYVEYKEDEWLTTLPCMHKYHRKCINRWLADHTTCPMCNNDISGT